MLQPGEIGTLKAAILGAYNGTEFKTFLLDFLGEEFHNHVSTEQAFPEQLSIFLAKFDKDDTKIGQLLVELARAGRSQHQQFETWAKRARVPKQATLAPEAMVTLDGLRIFISRGDLKKKIKFNKENASGSWVIQIKGSGEKSGVSYCRWYFKHLELKCKWFKTIYIDLHELFVDQQQPVSAAHVYTKIIKNIPQFTFTDKQFEHTENTEAAKTQTFFDNCLANRDELPMPCLIYIDQIKKAPPAGDLIPFIRKFVDLALENLSNIYIVLEYAEGTLSADAAAVSTIIEVGSFDEDNVEVFFENFYDELPVLFKKAPKNDKDTFVQEQMAILKEFVDLSKIPNVEAVGNAVQELFKNTIDEMLSDD